MDAACIVGLGASAGGLDALERFFQATKPLPSVAYVVALHLSPDHRSMMVELLGKQTPLSVSETVDGETILGGHVYVTPAQANVILEGDKLRLVARSPSPNLSINQMFESLARSAGERGIAVVLSGTGSDGKHGAEAVHAQGGLVLVQEPSSAKFDGMPLATIGAGVADAVLPPEQMHAKIASFADGTMHANTVPVGRRSDDEALRGIETLLDTHLGIDFAEYKAATVLRRISRRLLQLDIPNIQEYLVRLEHDPREVAALGKDLLISVTDFFRDPEVFATLEQEVLPQLVARRQREAIRVWIPGCATGQEAYSFAMLLAELNPAGGFKVFATDVSHAAIEVAAAGRYDESQMESVPSARRDRWFRAVGAAWEVDRELRRRVLFAPHNVTRDPPFTKLDIVSCRNLLIYLAPRLQHRVLSSFAFAVRPGGHLVLGTAETVGDLSDRFAAIERSPHIYERVGIRTPNLSAMRVPVVTRAAHPATDERTVVEAALQLLIRGVAPAAVLVNARLELVRVFGDADRLLELPVGAATLSLPSLLPLSLRTATNLAAAKALQTQQEFVIAVQDGPHGITSIRALPFTAGREETRYLTVTFEARTSASPPPAVEVSVSSTDRIVQLESELDLLRHSLQTTIEELETSNEELQATNEELMASNEELQSTNEELQSVNEELNTVNAEHQSKIAELTLLASDVDNLIGATTIGMLVLDSEMRVRRFSKAVSACMGLLRHDVDRPISTVSHNFVDLDLMAELALVSRSGTPQEHEATTKKGEQYLVRIAPYIGAERRLDGLIVTFVDLTPTRREESQRAKLQEILNALPEHIVVLDQTGTILFVNAAWSAFSLENGGNEQTTGPGASYLSACASVPDIRTGLAAVCRGEKPGLIHEYPCVVGGLRRRYYMHARSTTTGAVISHIDITTLGGQTS